MTGTRSIFVPSNSGARYVLGTTRHGQAVHALPFDSARQSQRPTAVCGARIVNAWGPAFTTDDGTPESMHPFGCYKCSRKIASGFFAA